MPSNYSEKETVSINRSKRRKIDVKEFEIKNLSKIDVKKEPKTFPDRVETDMKEEEEFNRKYFIWCCIQKLNSSDQNVSSLSGWLLKQRQFTEITQTVLRYVPPIPKKVTDFQTILYYMETLQNLAQQMNMPYVNITLDNNIYFENYVVLVIILIGVKPSFLFL